MSENATVAWAKTRLSSAWLLDEAISSLEDCEKPDSALILRLKEESNTMKMEIMRVIPNFELPLYTIAK